MYKYKITSPREQLNLWVTGRSGTYVLEADFDWLGQKGLLDALERMYNVLRIRRNEKGATLWLHARREQQETLLENVAEIFWDYVQEPW